MHKRHDPKAMPDKFYLNLDFPPEYRDEWLAVAQANDRKMKNHAEYVIKETIRQFKEQQRELVWHQRNTDQEANARPDPSTSLNPTMSTSISAGVGKSPS